MVTDRALRYRANSVMDTLKRLKECVLCGSCKSLVVDHKDGHEENTNPANLRWLCKACNTRLGLAFAAEGKGRRTNQYNPGAQNLAQYAMAAVDHKRGSHDAAGKILHETPKSRRQEYAAEIWRRRKEHAAYRRSEVPF